MGELKIDVERLDAHLALRAEVANLVNLVAGVHVGVDKVMIDLKDVKAECELKVRLENTYNILDRTLTTLDENPDIVKGLLETADSAVETTGQVGQQATQAGRRAQRADQRRRRHPRQSRQLDRRRALEHRREGESQAADQRRRR